MSNSSLINETSPYFSPIKETLSECALSRDKDKKVNNDWRNCY